MPTRTFQMTPDRLEQLRAQLAGQGVTLAGNAGSFVPPGHDEIALGYAYVNGTLTLTILHKAWYESADMIWSALAPYTG